MEESKDEEYFFRKNYQSFTILKYNFPKLPVGVVKRVEKNLLFVEIVVDWKKNLKNQTKNSKLLSNRKPKTFIFIFLWSHL